AAPAQFEAVPGAAQEDATLITPLGWEEGAPADVRPSRSDAPRASTQVRSTSARRINWKVAAILAGVLLLPVGVFMTYKLIGPGSPSVLSARNIAFGNGSVTVPSLGSRPLGGESFGSSPGVSPGPGGGAVGVETDSAG